MLPERADGSPLVREEIKLPPLGKRQTVFAYYQRLTMEQAFALTVVAKVTGTTPEAVIRTKLARRGMTVYPKGNAPDPNAPKAAPIKPGHLYPTGGAPLDPRISYEMAAPAEGGEPAEHGAEP